MKFQGKISKVLPELKGTSATGKEWRKVSYVLTYDATKPEYPRQVVFDVMGDRIMSLNSKKVTHTNWILISRFVNTTANITCQHRVGAPHQWKHRNP